MNFFAKIWFYLKYVWGFLTFPCFARKMRKLKKDDETLICLFPHLGDIVYGLSYAKQYKKDTGKKICVYCGNNMEYYVKQYDFIDRIITYDVKSMQTIYVAIFPFVRYMGKNKANKDGVFATVPSTLHFKGLTALEVYRDYIYNVSKNNLSLYPNINTPITSIKNFENVKDKIVILNPYSFSMKVDKKLFETIALSLQNLGFIVYTNCIPKFGQQPIKGTLVFDAKIPETYSVIENIACFISLRSGICDMAASGKGNLFVIYANNIHKREYFSVKELRSTNVCEEFYGGKKDILRIVRSVDNFIDNVVNKNK